MKKLTIGFVVLSAGMLFLASSCMKEKPGQPVPEEKKGLTIPANFDWQTVKNTQLDLQLSGTGFEAFNGYPVLIRDIKGNEVSQGILHNGRFRVTSPVSTALDMLFVSIGNTTMGSIAHPAGNNAVTFQVNAGMGGGGGTDTDGDGVPDAYDEFPDDVERAYSLSYPATGYVIYAFEDLWPSRGDFDFNDLGIAVKTLFYYNSNNEKIGGTEEIILHTIGCSLPNGLMVQFLEYDESNGYRPLPAGTVSNWSGTWKTRTGTGSPTADPAPNTVKVFDNVFDAQSKYYRNVGPWDPTNPIDASLNQVKPDTFRFSFRVNGNGHKNIVSDVFLLKGDPAAKKGDRGMEIHVAGLPATPLANSAYFKTSDDNSGMGKWYVTKANEPWAIKVWSASSIVFHYPLSKSLIYNSYPDFKRWVESNGSLVKDWYTRPDTNKTFNPAY